MRILAVDDDAAVRELLQDFLCAKGYDVEVCTDGPSALEVIRNNRPDLLLLDLMMPGMTGMEVLRRIRTEVGDLPVVVITAVAEEEVGRAALSAGASDYVTKPIDLPHLERVVGAVVLLNQA